MSAFCKDCGMDTEPWPPHRGTQEHFIVKNEVWTAAGMPQGRLREDMSLADGGGFLCVGCIEKRLGRLLKLDDFSPPSAYLLAGCQNTPRLLSRVGIAFMAIANAPLPDHIVDRWLESTLTNCIKRTPAGRGLKSVEVDGDEVILVYKSDAVSYRAGAGISALAAALRMDRDPEEGAGCDLLTWDDEEVAA